MKEWLFDQVMNFNIFMLFAILIFNVFLSKSNTQTLLKEQSQELYNELEEIKDEIRGNTKND